jgi:hypothetical protein
MSEKVSFEQFLFRTAFCVMACDGHIDNLEIDEIKKLAATTSFFKKINVEEELHRLLQSVRLEGRNIFTKFLDELGERDCDVVQELMVLEIVLRMIYVDTKLEINELKLTHLIRSKLKVADEVIFQRFGAVDVLLGDRKLFDTLEASQTRVPEFTGIDGSDEEFRSLDVDWDHLDRSESDL